MKCPECKTDNATQLLTSWLCINDRCSNFDAKHVQEQPQWISFKDQLYKQTPEGKRQSQLQMELAIEKMREDNHAELTEQARMQLEKIRHASQMQMENLVAQKPKEEDPLDAAIKEYLQRKLLLDPIKDITMDQID